MTIFVAILVLLLAIGVGIIVGLRRGPILGTAIGFGVMAAGAFVYIVLLAFSLPM